MILTTTNTLDGYKIKEYLGLVSGETIIGANMFKDFFAGIVDIVGGRSGGYEAVLIEAKETAIEEMKEKAEQLVHQELNSFSIYLALFARLFVYQTVIILRHNSRLIASILTKFSAIYTEFI